MIALLRISYDIKPGLELRTNVSLKVAINFHDSRGHISYLRTLIDSLFTNAFQRQTNRKTHI